MVEVVLVIIKDQQVQLEALLSLELAEEKIKQVLVEEQAKSLRQQEPLGQS